MPGGATILLKLRKWCYGGHMRVSPIFERLETHGGSLMTRLLPFGR